MRKGSPKRSRETPERPQPRAPVPAWRLRLDGFGNSPGALIAAALVLLVPCFWQSRLQAGDLSSHIYNAWLAGLIQRGKAPGLAISFQTTNVLFDLMLSAFYQMFGAGIAQRLSVAIAVLVFASGAFALVCTVSGKRAWSVLPAIAVLAYGWVFHMGFFNFYVSLGLCFWALSLAWNSNTRRLTLAAAVIAVAWIAHPLPVAWSLSMLGYIYLARRIDPDRRWRLAAAAVGAMIALSALMRFTMDARWVDDQVSMITGLDQARVFGEKYGVVYFGFLVLWIVAILRLGRESGFRSLMSGIPFQLCLLGAAGVLILPDWLKVPGYRHALAFIAERMSLPAAVLICALVAAAKTRAYERYAMVGVALVFFAFLYADEATLNAFEDSVDRAIAQLPRGQRVISGVDDPFVRVDPLPHMVDRACLERCYSYANYEPSTGQFRVRAMIPNAFVISDYDDSWKLQNGVYIVQNRDVPLYQVVLDGAGRAFVRPLPTGVRNGMSYWNGLSNTGPAY